MTVNVPTPAPADTARVAEVGVVAFHEPAVTVVVPVTLFCTLTVLEPDHVVLMPAKVKIAGWLAGIDSGDTVKLVGGGGGETPAIQSA